MTITERLNEINNNLLSVSALDKVDGKPFLGGLLPSDSVAVSMTSVKRSAEEISEILKWFADGGVLETYTRENIPHGERKNTKKREITRYYVCRKGCLYSQIGHETSYNYNLDCWTRLANRPPEGLVYGGKNLVNHIMQFNPKIVELGEKK